MTLITEIDGKKVELELFFPTPKFGEQATMQLSHKSWEGHAGEVLTAESFKIIADKVNKLYIDARPEKEMIYQDYRDVEVALGEEGKNNVDNQDKT